MVIWFQGEVVFAWLSRRMQVMSRGGLLQSYGHLVLGCSRICMVESSGAGEVEGRFFYNHMVISF